MIPETQHLIALCIQPTSSRLIIGSIVHVLPTIQLNDQAPRMTNKIDDIVTYDYLPFEFQSHQAMTA